jgi:hypothetical protein
MSAVHCTRAACMRSHCTVITWPPCDHDTTFDSWLLGEHSSADSFLLFFALHYDEGTQGGGSPAEWLPAFLAAIFFRTPAMMAETLSGGRDLTNTSRSLLRHTPEGPLPSPGKSSAVTQSSAEWPDCCAATLSVSDSVTVDSTESLTYFI